MLDTYLSIPEQHAANTGLPVSLNGSTKKNMGVLLIVLEMIQSMWGVYAESQLRPRSSQWARSTLWCTCVP